MDQQKDNSGAARFWLIAFGIIVLSGAAMFHYLSKSARDVIVPTLNAQEQAGAAVFSERCTECHGANAAGGASGPTLVHRFYEPNLHGDSTFYDAIRFGAKAHHWNHGDMPPVDNIDADEIKAIVAYIRKLQRANGIAHQ
jgi:mono/diheme cytochrome c family protein